ncbi:putative lipoprotein [Candidatus Sulfotelmatobacter kueseliae]|uniref:Putative lipoprotein n=1 Tax=Candidatus Sulfotelmatobacter kueseliae TaxID=2042962 RepID=A0A2U3JW03_9BACT|nr:putative lipoprotein [Candidatus Sulfotelmatobacter kueseliae]
MTSMAFTARAFLFRLAVAVAVVFLFAMLSRAGGPESIAGTSYFDASATGQPLVWPQGQITYYTDQGDLSPVLPNASANSFVAGAFSQWTAVPTAALAATSGGQLAEDVTGSNITVSNGVITGPADITPSATGTPIGVVYDYDGSVTDALLGSGAGDSSQCFFNAAYGGNDNFGSAATYQHALIVINGQCALESPQLVDVEYRLVRVIGNVLGLGWSQVNLNVITGNPHPTAADYAGFPVMHYTDPVSCVPITTCYPNPYQLAMDDIAAISRLYPVTTQNQSNFPGKQVFSSAMARIYGSVWFTGPSGNSTQPMQGVNVVARWIDPSTGLPPRQYAASSVSGFLFTGNAGNPITGFDDALGNPFSQWGSDSTTVEGFFDLAGLQLPKGGSGQYQLAVEALDGTWSVGVGPYAPLLVAPSGSSAPITVTVTAGQEVEQDILMAGSAQPVPSWAASETWTAPAPIPSAGNWRGSLSGYGDVPYFLLPAQANRTLSVAVTALDQTGRASESKAQPVIGMWAASDPQGTAPPAFTSSSFNTVTFGMTRLDAQVATSGNFLIGISDLRGDGRPDYHYQAQVLYADSVSPARIGVSGGPVTVSGTGLAPGQTASVGTSAAPVLAVNAGQMILDAPPNSGGPESITITDPTTGGSTTMTNALTYGAAASDKIVLLNGHNPPTPVGTQAPYAVIVEVLASDGVTPVAGATIGWSATNGVQLSACSSSSSCTVTTDAGGGATTWLTPTMVGTATITATLAPGVYSPAESVNATLSATESSSDIGVSTTYLWISQGATVSAPLTARVLSNGVAQPSVTVNFKVVQGTGTLSAASATTNSTGYATVTLSVTGIAALVQVSACVAPANAPCQTIYANPVPLSQQQLEPVAGAGQVSTGQAFQPVVVRVTDSSSPPNPVLAAPVLFQTTVLRPGGSPPAGGNGETNPINPAMPVILSVTQTNATTDINGLASVTPSSGSFSPPLEVNVAVTAGTTAQLDDSLEVLPAPADGRLE